MTLAKPEVRVKSFFDQYFKFHNLCKTEVDVYEINSKTKTISQLPTQTTYTDYYNIIGSMMCVAWIILITLCLFTIRRLEYENKFIRSMYVASAFLFCVACISIILNLIGFGIDKFRIFSDTYSFLLMVIFCGFSFIVVFHKISDFISIPELYEWIPVFLMIATIVVSALIPTTGSPEIILMKFFGIVLLCKCILIVKNIFQGRSRIFA